ncbi:MAG: Ig-like domain-containing protein, partial [Oscillospiraceae bacterium]|nr:Ig-like domain-containing protein [Oscillospiraceae bacterium]
TTDPKADANYEDTVTITVNAIAVTGISVSPSYASGQGAGGIPMGTTLRLNANVTPTSATYRDVTWEVDDQSVAAISSSGVLTPRSPGVVNVVARAKDGSGTASAPLTITIIAPT